MSSLIENTKFLSSLQQRILENLQNNRPAETGISREDLQRGIQILRQDRRQAVTSAASSTRKKKAAPPPDLNDLLSNFSTGG